MSQPHDRSALLRSAWDRYAEREGSPSPLLVAREGQSMLINAFSSSIEKVEMYNEQDAIITYAITTERLDRANDIVRSAGVMAEDYKTNPVVLWCHNGYEPAVGTGHDLRQGVTKSGERAILADIKFHSYTKLAREVQMLAQERIINAVSIGFIPFAWNEYDARELIEQGRAYPFYDTVREYTSWELLEFSLCNVPMNASALRQDMASPLVLGDKAIKEAIDKGVITEDAEILRVLGGLPKIVVGGIAATKEGAMNRSTESETKAGRVISDKNLKQLKSAREAIDSVIQSAEADGDSKSNDNQLELDVNAEELQNKLTEISKGHEDLQKNYDALQKDYNDLLKDSNENAATLAEIKTLVQGLLTQAETAKATTETPATEEGTTKAKTNDDEEENVDNDVIDDDEIAALLGDGDEGE